MILLQAIICQLKYLKKNNNFRDQLNNILDYIIEKHYTLWPGIEDQKIKILNKIEKIYFSKVQSQNDIASSCRIMNLKIDNLNGSLVNKMFMIILILAGNYPFGKLK